MLEKEKKLYKQHTTKKEGHLERNEKKEKEEDGEKRKKNSDPKVTKIERIRKRLVMLSNTLYALGLFFLMP